MSGLKADNCLYRSIASSFLPAWAWQSANSDITSRSSASSIPAKVSAAVLYLKSFLRHFAFCRLRSLTAVTDKVVSERKESMIATAFL